MNCFDEATLLVMLASALFAGSISTANISLTVNSDEPA